MSLYGQDSWRASQRLVLTYGLRWELNPAPSGRSGTTLAAWENVNDPPTIALAPLGTPLWSTTHTNVAPRIGLAYKLTAAGDFVLRASWGIFYDLASDAVGGLAGGFPNLATNIFPPATLPLADARPFVPALSLQPPYPSLTRGFASDLKLPRSYQWNIAVEKALGHQQSLSLTYVGQAGRDLLRQEDVNQPTAAFSGVFAVTGNGAYSNYNALQVQFRRRASNRLQALVNYTWSHSLDNASNDVVAAVSHTVISAAEDYASSGFDVRHSFSGALVYAVPKAADHGPLGYLSKDWSVDAVVVARTGFPFNASAALGTIGGANPRPDLVPGQPLWIQNPNAGGGKSLNPLAFATPPPGRQGTEGRNDISGFGLTQVDLSLVRKFTLDSRVGLQFRADAFNVLNHPNFTNPLGLYLGPAFTTFLQSTSMLNQGLGGLNPLFQQGGPRSLQLSLKLTF